MLPRSSLLAAVIFITAQAVSAQDGAYLPFALQAKQLAGRARADALAATAIATTTASKMPAPATTAPLAERTGAAIGADVARFALADHQHPRLTSTTASTPAAPNSHMIGSDGLSPPIMFTRSFASEPGIDIMPIKPNAADILLPPYVSDWVMGTGADAGRYVDVIIGWKKLQMTSTFATVLSVSVLTSQTPTQVAAVGVRFSAIAVARSDVPAT